MNAEKIQMLQLARSVSCMQYYNQLRQYGSVSKALENINEPVPLELIKDEVEKVHSIGAEFIFHTDSEYPKQLLSITTPPPVLTVRGRKELLNKNCVGVVGARQASLAALKITTLIAQELSFSGQTIVSGMALGVDSRAHQASLHNGTIAVLGCGIDVIYPFENEELYKQIANKGLVITEYPFGTPVKRESFPARNRIIAGLSWGLVVVEAGMKSGSMITVRHAIAQGKDVFAVPGHPLDTNARGCNALIREGAFLTESGQDVISHFHKMPAKQTLFDMDISLESEMIDVEDACSIILPLLTSTPVLVDEIVRHTNLPVEAVRAALVSLEIEGKVQVDQGFKVVKI